MFDCVLPDRSVFRALVSGEPQDTGGIEFARMLRHPRREYRHEIVGHREFRSRRKSVRSFGVILKFGVKDKTQVVIKAPLFRVVLDAELDQRECRPRESGAARWFRSEKVCSKFVSRQKLRIKLGGDFEKWREQAEVARVVVMLSPEILHGTRPVDVGKQSGIAEAHAPQNLRRA